MRPSFTTLLALVFLLASFSVATAQQSSSLAPQSVTAGWQDGFVIQSADEASRLAIGATLQMDGRFSLDDPSPFVDTFLIRKARPTLSGRLARFFDFKLMPDFGNGTPTIMDAYFDIRFSPKLRIRTGKDKTPVGYELLLGDPYLLFPERMLSSSLVPNRDVGVQVQGDLAAGRAAYSAGIFNGVPDASSTTTDVDTNNGKEVAGRFIVQPFKSSGSAGPISGLGVHVGASTARDIGPAPSFKTSAGQMYSSYADDVTADGRHSRFTPAVFYYFKSFGAFAEYVRSSQSLSRASALTDIVNHGWGVTGSFVLTGEPTSERGVRPKHSFAPANHSWGALQIVARYSRLAVDPHVFSAGLAASTASPNAASFTIGANWYPAPVVKYYVTFERTTFESSTSCSRPTERVVLFRTQLAF